MVVVLEFVVELRWVNFKFLGGCLLRLQPFLLLFLNVLRDQFWLELAHHVFVADLVPN